MTDTSTAHSASLGMNSVIAEIAAERRRQIEVEGWTPEHDDAHARGEMARAALCYADPDPYRCPVPKGGEESNYPHPLWPWRARWWKPKDRRRDLIRAAALTVAEIERLDRAAGTKPERGTVLMGPLNPTGWKLEELLAQLQTEVRAKHAKLANDVRPVAALVRGNNEHILRLLAQAEALQRQSYVALDAMAPNQGPLGTPRIGAGSEGQS